jgi:hypothetical protein
MHLFLFEQFVLHLHVGMYSKRVADIVHPRFRACTNASCAACSACICAVVARSLPEHFPPIGDTIAELHVLNVLSIRPAHTSDPDLGSDECVIMDVLDE